MDYVFKDTAAAEIYTLSLHDALPICPPTSSLERGGRSYGTPSSSETTVTGFWKPSRRSVWAVVSPAAEPPTMTDRKSTRLNSSHANISFAVFCLNQIT